MKRGGSRRAAASRSREGSARARFFLALLFALGMSLTFFQIERGTGQRTLVLLFTLFDLLLVAAIAAGFLSLTRRWRTSLLAGASIVLVLYFCSWLKTQYTLMPAQAHDLIELYSAWPLVKSFAWPGVVASAACALLLAMASAREEPKAVGLTARALLAVLATLLFLSCGLLDDWVPEDDADLFAGPTGPKIALFYRSIYDRPVLEPAAFPALGPYCCMTSAGPLAAAFTGSVKPNIVVVLQESTFPPSSIRGYESGSNFLFTGSAPLKVHVRGGGTWVEEYAVLHGVPPPVYGRHFLQINRLGPASGLPGRLAPLLHGQGYDTTTVYPTAGSLLSAESFHRSLGIRRFLSCTDFEPCRQAADWNQTPDSIFFEEVLTLLRKADRPQFVFTATMRQHSPHSQLFPLKLHQQEVMQEYGRRLALSGSEAEAFVTALGRLARPTIVLMYGDHVPSDVVAAFSKPEFATDTYQTFFNLYDPTGAPRAAEMMARFPDISAVDSAFLDVLLLHFAGFTADYISTKLAFMHACRGAFCAEPHPSP